jgi:hypothetical protein
MFEIVRSRLESDRTTDFVAIGNIINEVAYSYHAGFVIQHEGMLYEFHYTGKDVKFNPIENDYFHKITNTIASDEVAAFVAQCLQIQKKANPKYGLYYSGECYDKEGNYISSSNLGEVMTCVGFCLNVLKGFLEEEYLLYSDWTAETPEFKQFLNEFCRINNIDPLKIASPLSRRITPRECLTTCFFSQLPITKDNIDKKIVEINHFFASKAN